MVCRANPPVWSCRVARLPAMQLDRSVKKDEFNCPSVVAPLMSNWLLTDVQSWYHIDSGKGVESRAISQVQTRSRGDVRARCGVACGVEALCDVTSEGRLFL